MKNQLTYFLVALLIAFGLWVYVVTTVSPESEETFYNIAVEWDAGSEAVLKDKGLMVVSGNKPTVTLRLRGNRSDLSKLKNSDITVIADLAKIGHAGEQHLSYNVFFTGNTNAFEVVNQYPGTLTLQVAEWATKDVQVEVKYQGVVGPNYIAFTEDVIPNPSAITITGPKEVVDRVDKAVVKVNLEGKTETFTVSDRAILCDSDGKPVDVASITADGEVRLTLRILPWKDLALKVNPVYGGGVTAENSTVIQDYYTIRVAGNEKILAALPDVLDLGQINMAEIIQNTTLKLPITGGMLQGAENISGITEVTVQVTVPERITTTLDITDMSQINVVGLPEGLKLDYVTEKVAVTLIGREDQVNAVTAADLTITIDASNAVVDDNQAYTPTILVSPKYPDVGATIGPITVNISQLPAASGGIP